MIIYGPDNRQLLSIDVDDDSYCLRELCGKDELILKFALVDYVDIPIGSYCIADFIDGSPRYELLLNSNVTVVNRRNFEYNVVFESSYGSTRKYRIHNMVDGRLKFDLTAKAYEHLAQLVNNLNERDNSFNWKIGSCIESSEKLISYNHTTCQEALSLICDTFDTEFEIVGNVISIHNVDYNKSTPLELSYGYQHGFKSGVKRMNYDDNPPVERLFVQGGERNVNRKDYGSSTLLLPPAGTRCKYNGETFMMQTESGYSSFIGREYVVSDNRLSITRYDKPLSSKTEDSLDCSEVYPSRVGTVSKVRYLYGGEWLAFSQLPYAVQNADWNAEPYSKILIDFFDDDTNIPDYSQCKIAGETMTIVFQSGMMAGREIDLSSYVHTEKVKEGDHDVDRLVGRFKVQRSSIDGYLMPGNVFRIKGSEEVSNGEGDKYIVYNCSMPGSYYDEAQKELLRKAVSYLYDHEDIKFTFKGELDEVFAKRNWIDIKSKIKTGSHVKFRDRDIIGKGTEDYFDVRIVSVKTFVNTPNKPIIELSNESRRPSVASVIHKIENEQSHNEILNERSLDFTKRTYQQAEELIKALEGAVEGFSNGITPVTVHTMQMLLGSDNLQFRFVRSLTDMTPTVSPIIVNDDEKKVTATSAYIQHMTLGQSGKAIESASNKTYNDYRRWALAANEWTAISEHPNTPYYLYAIVSKTAETGVYELREKSLPFDNGSTYALLIGVLSSEYDGSRSFAPMYGYTEILPGQITTDLIRGSQGGSASSYWDLLRNKVSFGGKLKYNIDGDGALVLDGTLTQTGNGDTAPISAWCGQYDANRVYKLGDEVFYTSAGVTSTYIYINIVSGYGHPVTDVNYWQVSAKGVKGEDGASAVMVYNSAYTRPATPSGSSYPPHGWSTSPQTATESTSIRTSFNGNWMLQSNYWVADTIRHNESTRQRININTLCENTIVTFYLYVVSEEYYDRLIVGKPDEEVIIGGGPNTDSNYLDKISGGSPSSPVEMTIQVMFKSAGQHFIDIWFAKDSSTTVTGEIAKFMIGNSVCELPVWMSQGKLVGSTATDWTYPILISGSAGYNGINGAAIVFRGKYNVNPNTGQEVSMEYVGTAERNDLVLYEYTKSDGTKVKEYFKANSSVGGVFKDKLPTNSMYWTKFSSNFENVATGFLFAEEAVIENAVIRKLRTSDTGKRVVALDNQLTMFDAYGDQRLLISGEALSSASSGSTSYLGTQSILNKTISYNRDYIEDGKSTGISITTNSGAIVTLPALTAYAALSYDSVIGNEIVGSFRFGYEIDGSLDSSTVTEFDVQVNRSGQGVGYIPSVAIPLGSGTHTIKVVCTIHIMSENNDEGTMTFSGYTTCSSDQYVRVNYSTRMTEIGSNGFRTMFSTNSFAEFSTDGANPTFIIRAGNYGLRITTSGIQKTTNGGGTWINL